LLLYADPELYDPDRPLFLLLHREFGILDHRILNDVRYC